MFGGYKLNKFRIAAIDMDGTLLNSNHEITPATAEMLRETDAMGCKVVLCTGRIFHAVEPYIQQLGLDNFAIVGNGAQIRKAFGGEVLDEHLLSKEIIVSMAKVGNKYGGHPRVYGTDGRVYVESLTDEDTDYSSWTKTEIVPIGNFEKYLPDKLIKIINVMPGEDAVANVMSEGKSLFGNKVYITPGMLGFTECMNSKASKGLAVKRLAEMCSVPLEQVIVAGDHHNDITMYDLPGVFGITCSNAQEVIRKKAKIVGKSNDEDGIALIIRELVSQ